MKRKSAITFEVEETIILRQTVKISSCFCPQCEAMAEMASPCTISDFSNFTEREIFRLVEDGKIHFIETGRILICLNSIENLEGTFKKMKRELLKLSLLIIFVFWATSVQAQTPVFTYQGKLTEGMAAANGQYDFVFKLFDSATNGIQIGTDEVCEDIQVSGGIFTVKLNFGTGAFTDGTARFLELSVRTGTSSGAFTTLSPRQQITSAPFSIKSLSAANADSLSSGCFLCVTDAQIQSIDGSKVTGTVANAATATNVSGIVAIENGGTGSPIQNFVDLSNNQSVGGNKNFTGIISGNGAGLTNIPGTFRWQTVAGIAQQAQPNNGYLTLNDFEQVTITLPNSPNIGDIVRITGVGAGGWRIAQNEKQTILGLDLELNGIFWTPRQTEREWISVASSLDGTKLVAVARFDQIYTSTDSGATWTPRELSRNWISVASSENGNNLIAAVRNGRIYTSINSGITWSPRENNRNWTAVASSADGTKLIAAVSGGQIYTSNDSGGTWTARENNRDWSSVASSGDGTKLIASVFGGQIYTSNDSGGTWTARESKRDWSSVASSTDGTKLIAADRLGRIYISGNSGINWIPRGIQQFWTSISSSSDGTKLVAVADLTQIYTSTDSGATWTPSESPRAWTAVTTSADGKKIVAAGRFEKIFTSFLSPAETTAAGSAGFLIGGQFTSVELQYVGGGLFLAINRKGTIFGY